MPIRKMLDDRITALLAAIKEIEARFTSQEVTQAMILEELGKLNLLLDQLHDLLLRERQMLQDEALKFATEATCSADSEQSSLSRRGHGQGVVRSPTPE